MNKKWIVKTVKAHKFISAVLVLINTSAGVCVVYKQFSRKDVSGQWKLIFKNEASLNPILLELKDLLTSRSKLLTQLRAIQSYLKELKINNSKTVQVSIEKAHKQAIKGLETSIQEIGTKIQRKIKTDELILKNYNL